MESNLSNVSKVVKPSSGGGGGGGGTPSNVKIFGKPGQGKQQQQGQAGKGLPGQPSPGSPGGRSHKITKGGNTMDKHLTGGQGNKPKVLNPNNVQDLEPNDWGNLSEQQKEAMMKDLLTNALDETERKWGAGEGGIPRGFDRKHLLPREDWKTILQNFLDDESQRVINDMRPNMREIAGTGSWAAGSEYVKQDIKCMIAIDVSGSIDQNDLTLFVTKIHEIIEEPGFAEVKMELLFWDGKVEKAVTIDTSEEGSKTSASQTLQGITTSGRVIGGGGTDPSCINTWVMANKDKLDMDVEEIHLLIMTDGYFDSNFTLPHTHVQPIWMLNGKKATDEHIKANNRHYTDIHFIDLKQS